MHSAAFAFIAAHIPPDVGCLLEFGSRNINGTVRTLVPTVRYVGVDVAPGDGVDVVADAGTVAFNEEFDLVVCAEVFEHADDESCAAMTTNAFRHLAPGGVFLVTAAGPGREPHSAYDGAHVRPDEFYRNVAQADLECWLSAAGFAEFAVTIQGADVRGRAVK